jgi:DNA-directed RNA polymerase specialized sigma24 family protein
VIPATLDELSDGAALATEDDPAVFDREWALRLMETSLAAVQREIDPLRWPVLCAFLPGEGEPPSYEDAALQLRVTPQALKTTVHRMRRRMREEVRAAVARTLGSVRDVDGELDYLHRVLRSNGH